MTKQTTITKKTCNNEELTFSKCNPQELCRQVGTMNILAISGGRVIIRDTGVTLPVSNGYVVTIDLCADDTYTVSRGFKRGSKVINKGTLDSVYCSEVGATAYAASCFRNVEFPR